MKKIQTFSVVLAAIILCFMALPSYSDDMKKEMVTSQPVININTASVQTLKTLSGIGKVKAEAIVAYREKHGSFSSIKDLAKVEGIGKKTLKAIAKKVTLSDR